MGDKLVTSLYRKLPQILLKKSKENYDTNKFVAQIWSRKKQNKKLQFSLRVREKKKAQPR